MNALFFYFCSNKLIRNYQNLKRTKKPDTHVLSRAFTELKRSHIP